MNLMEVGNKFNLHFFNLKYRLYDIIKIEQ